MTQQIPKVKTRIVTMLKVSMEEWKILIKKTNKYFWIKDMLTDKSHHHNKKDLLQNLNQVNS